MPAHLNHNAARANGLVVSLGLGSRMVFTTFMGHHDIELGIIFLMPIKPRSTRPDISRNVLAKLRLFEAMIILSRSWFGGVAQDGGLFIGYNQVAHRMLFCLPE
ncbi:MAG: hypothetical protein H6633_26120 [Anaerolineales bacterium]|nr:hypothetical protein [Anaerolineales bacterium]